MCTLTSRENYCLLIVFVAETRGVENADFHNPYFVRLFQGKRTLFIVEILTISSVILTNINHILNITLHVYILINII